MRRQQKKLWKKRNRLKTRLYTQESGLEGRPILVERGAEVQEGGQELLEALRNRDPGHLEKVRTRLGQWVTAGDEDESNLGAEGGGVKARSGRAGRKYSWRGLRLAK